MRIKLLLLAFSIFAGVFMGWKYSSPSSPGFINEQCYVLLKSRYESDTGVEYFDAVITFSFLSDRGTITANAELTTADKVKTPLMQRMNFTYAPPNNNEYTLKIVSVMNSSLADHLSVGTSRYMRNMLNINLVSPSGIKIRIMPEKSGDYLIYNNVIPWAYCNDMSSQ